jgi:hypothetical protein
MQINLNMLIAAALCVLPAALALILVIRKRNDAKAASRTPFKELQRRPPGEALRLKIEDLDDQIYSELSGLLVFPALLVFATLAQHPKDWLTPVLFFIISAGASAFFGVRLFKLMGTRANYRLGFEGERLVGEELTRLVAVGFEIYHDVPFDEFNIDHVLVGPRGLFTIETKTRRKPLNDDGKKEFRVQFDGRALQWPWGFDGHGIEQAKNNARTVAVWLTSATGETVRAVPILTLPGWLVERKAPSDGIHVLNPKEIYQVCASQPEKITESQIQRIKHQLNQKCRIEVT